MTTCAYRDGVVAVDSLMSEDSNIVTYHAKKLFMNNNFILTGAGNYQDLLAVWDWIMDPDSGKPNVSDHSVFWLFEYSDSQIRGYRLENKLYKFEIPTIEGFAALGSGTDYALGAMARGASAREAVLIASMFDVYTDGGDIVTVNLASHFSPGTKPRGRDS